MPSSASCLWYTRCASSSCSLVTYFVICLFETDAYSIAQAGLELILHLNDESFDLWSLRSIFSKRTGQSCPSHSILQVKQGGTQDAHQCSAAKHRGGEKVSDNLAGLSFCGEASCHCP